MKRRLLVSYLTVTLFVLLILELPLGVVFARHLIGELTAQVERDAVVTATLVEDDLEAGRPVGASAGLRRYAERTGARVVVVDARGLSVADSGGPTGRSFASRPEVARALGGRAATGTRHSATLGADLLFVAVPVASSGTVHGAVRITYPTSAVDARVWSSWLTLAGLAAVSLLAAAGVAVGLAGSVSRPLRRLERAAADLGGGDLEARAPTGEGPPEVRVVAAVFNDTAGRLAALLAAQDAFVADASHQLRSPLTALRLRLENLEAEVGGVAREDLRAAAAEARRLSRTVDGLLALARADRAAGEPAGLVDPVAVLEDRRAAWAPLADERNVHLVVEPGDSPGPVRATPDRLVQVLDNLLANALDVAPSGSRVTLRAEPAEAGGRVELHVLDEGPGLSDDERARAFHRFWRGRGARPAQDGLGGSGLGLPIARRLVAADGGTVELRPRAGGGTDAVVRLAAAATTPAGAGTSTRSSSLAILLTAEVAGQPPARPGDVLPGVNRARTGCEPVIRHPGPKRREGPGSPKRKERLMSTTLIRRCTAGAIALAGLLHLLLVPEYLSEKPYVGVLFLLSVPLTGTAAFLLWTREGGLGWSVGALLAAGMIAGFVASRTVGLPGYHPSDWAEGFPSMAVESVVLGLAAVALLQRRSSSPALKHG